VHRQTTPAAIANTRHVPQTSAHLARSILTLGVAQAITWVGGAALAVLLPRYLGDANLGKIAFGMAFIALVGLLSDLGTATFLTREIARAPERAASLTMNTFAMRIALSGISLIVAIVAVNMAAYDDVSRHILYALSAGMIVVTLSNTAVAALQGLRRIRALAAFSVVTKVGYALIALSVLFLGAGPFEVALAWTVGQGLGLILVLVALARQLRGSLHLLLDRAVIRLLFLGGLPFFLWQAALLVYGQVDAVILSFLTQENVVGWYSAAYRLVAIPIFLPSIILTVIFPALSATASDSRAFNALVRRATHLVLVSSIPMVLGIMLLADKLVDFLGYPEAFQHSVLPLILLAPHVVLVGVNMVFGTALNTRDRQKQWALAACAAAVLNPTLNFPAIAVTQAMWGNGAIGASTITTLTEAFMLCSALYLLPRGVLGRETARDAARCVTAGAIMAAVVWFARDLPLVGVVVLGGLVYAGACLLVGAVSIDELRTLRIHLMNPGVPNPTPAA
jgi:O-antigen/teichoic acid export membrane protein